MKLKFPLLIVILVFISCKTKQKPITKAVVDNTYQIRKIKAYKDYINQGSNDADEIQEGKDFFSKKSHAFKESKGITFSTFLKGKIVKIKTQNYIENNFIKIKSYYYKNDKLVSIKINELIHTKNNGGVFYTREFYFDNSKVLLDTKKEDTKYRAETLRAFASEKLKKEYKLKGNGKSRN